MRNPFSFLKKYVDEKSNFLNLKISFVLLIILTAATVLQFLLPIGLIVLIFGGSSNLSSNLIIDLYLMGVIWTLIDYFVLLQNSKTLSNDKINPILGIIGFPQFLFGSFFSGILLLGYFVYQLGKRDSMDFLVLNALDISPSLILSGVVLLFIRGNGLIHASILLTFGPVILGLAFQIIAILYIIYSRQNNSGNNIKLPLKSLISFATSGFLAIFLSLLIIGIVKNSLSLPLEIAFMVLLTATVMFSFYDVSGYIRQHKLSPIKVKEIEDLAYTKGVESGRALALYEIDGWLGSKLKDKFDEGTKKGYKDGRDFAEKEYKKRFKELEDKLKAAELTQSEKANLCIDLFNLEKPSVQETNNEQYWVTFSRHVDNRFNILVKIVHPDITKEKESSGMFRSLKECKVYLQSEEFKRNLDRI